MFFLYLFTFMFVFKNTTQNSFSKHVSVNLSKNVSLLKTKCLVGIIIRYHLFQLCVIYNA